MFYAGALKDEWLPPSCNIGIVRIPSFESLHCVSCGVGIFSRAFAIASPSYAHASVRVSPVKETSAMHFIWCVRCGIFSSDLLALVRIRGFFIVERLCRQALLVSLHQARINTAQLQQEALPAESESSNVSNTPGAMYHLCSKFQQVCGKLTF